MQKQPLATLAIILLVATLAQVSTDMYIPSLAAIAHHFNASVGAAQATMSYFVLGIAVTGLIYGSLSEIIGRRNALMIGITIAVAGALLCLSAQSITQLQLGRFIQGCGLGAASSLWRSIFRDTYAGDELAQKSSYLGNAIIITSVLAPFLGGYIQHYADWHVTFMVLSSWSLLVLLAVLLYFQETGQHHGKHRTGIKFALTTYKELLQDKRFMGFTFCSFLAYGGLFAWFTAGPVVLIKGAGISSVLFGWLSIITALSMAAGATLNGKLVKKLGSIGLMQIGWVVMALAGLLMFVAYHLYGITVIDVLLPASLFVFGSSLIFANAFSNAFENIGHIAGYGGGLYSSIQLTGGALFSAVLSHVSTVNQVPMALLFIASGVLSWLVSKIALQTDPINTSRSNV